MIILPQINQLQRADLADIHGTGGILSSGYYRNITGTFSSLGSDVTSVIAVNFNATITNTGPAFQNSYTYSYPSNWPLITTNDYSTVPSVTLNSGQPGTNGSPGGGGGGTAGGGATSGGSGGRGGSGGNGFPGRRWDEQTLACNNTVYGSGGSGGTGFLGQAGGSSINGCNGSNGVSGPCGGTGGTGGVTVISTAPVGGLGGAGGGGGGGGQSIFCRYSYPSYTAQNMDTIFSSATVRFHGPGGNGASGHVSGGGGTNGIAGGIPAPSWPATNPRSGCGGIAGVTSPVSDATPGGSGGVIVIQGPNADSYPSSGSGGDLGSPPDYVCYSGNPVAGVNGTPGLPGIGANPGSNGSTGGTGDSATCPSAGGGGGGRGGTGGNGVIQNNGASGGPGGAGGAGGAGGKPGKSLGLIVYNRVSGSINTSGYFGPQPFVNPGSLGQSCIHPFLGPYFGASGGAGGQGGQGGQGSSGRVLLIGRCTQFYNNPNFITTSTPTGSSGVNGFGENGAAGTGGIWVSFNSLNKGTDGSVGTGGVGGSGCGITSTTPNQSAFYILT